MGIASGVLLSCALLANLDYDQVLSKFDLRVPATGAFVATERSDELGDPGLARFRYEVRVEEGRLVRVTLEDFAAGLSVAGSSGAQFLETFVESEWDRHDFMCWIFE